MQRTSLRRANRSNPGDLGILQNLGESLRMQERYEEAIEIFTGIIESNPDLPLTHAALGDALFRLQRHDEALAALERALALAPDASFAPSLHVLAGFAELSAGRPAMALEAFDRALAIDPRGRRRDSRPGTGRSARASSRGNSPDGRQGTQNEDSEIRYEDLRAAGYHDSATVSVADRQPLLRRLLAAADRAGWSLPTCGQRSSSACWCWPATCRPCCGAASSGTT